MKALLISLLKPEENFKFIRHCEEWRIHDGAIQKNFKTMKIEKIDNVLQVNLQELAAIFNQYRQFYKQDSNINSVQEFLQKRIENQDSSIFIAKNDEDKIIGFIKDEVFDNYLLKL
jgi:hypothetical protein